MNHNIITGFLISGVRLFIVRGGVSLFLHSPEWCDGGTSKLECSDGGYGSAVVGKGYILMRIENLSKYYQGDNGVSYPMKTIRCI